MTTAQLASAAMTPTFADRDKVAAASASAETAVSGSSQPSVSPSASPATNEATSPSSASVPHTATQRTSKIIRSEIGIVRPNSKVGSTPGPYAYATPIPARAGASSATHGVSVLVVAITPAPSTTALARIQESTSDGVVTNARANPVE